MRRFRRFRDWILCGFIYAGFLVGHAVSYSETDGIRVFPDSFNYYTSSRLPLTDGQFWGEVRPPGTLLFYKLFGEYDRFAPLDPDSLSSMPRIEDATLLHAQVGFSLAAFSFLAFACARSARTGSGRIVLFAFPLLFSLIPSIANWNFLALSESLAISLFAVFVAAWILFLSASRSSFWLAGVAMTALLWGSVRDTNAWVLVMIAGIMTMVVVASRKSSRVPLMALSVWFVLAFTLMNVSANAGNRWFFPFFNVMGQRILPVPEHVSYFADHGMPISPALLGRAGKWGSDDDFAFWAPDLEKFRVWTAANGKVTYMKFLISRWIWSMTTPALEVSRDFLVMAGATLPYPERHFPDPLPSYSAPALIFFLIGQVVTVCLAFVLWRRGWLHRFPHLAVPLTMILLSVPHAWLVWHGDPMETARHNLTSFMQFSMGFVLLWLYVLDHWCAVRAGLEEQSAEFRERRPLYVPAK